MKIIEILLVVVIILAIIMKILFMPGGDEIIMIAMTTLSMLYFLGGVLLFNHVGIRAMFKGGLGKLKAYSIVTGLGAGVAMSIILTGILFKLLELTGGDELLIIGSFAVGVSLALFTIRYLMYKDSSSVYAIIRTGVTLMVGVFLLLISSMTLIRWQYRDHPAYIQAVQDQYDNPGVDSLWKKRDLERRRVMMPKDAFEKYEKDYHEGRK